MNGNNIFKNNIAENAGGGIKWDDIEPTIENDNIYSDNYAVLYGNEIASFAQMLI